MGSIPPSEPKLPSLQFVLQLPGWPPGQDSLPWIWRQLLCAKPSSTLALSSVCVAVEIKLWTSCPLWAGALFSVSTKSSRTGSWRKCLLMEKHKSGVGCFLKAPTATKSGVTCQEYFNYCMKSKDGINGLKDSSSSFMAPSRNPKIILTSFKKSHNCKNS